MRGSMSLVNVEDPTAFLRGNYLKMLGSYSFGDSRNGAAYVLNAIARIERTGSSGLLHYGHFCEEL